MQQPYSNFVANVLAKDCESLSVCVGKGPNEQQSKATKFDWWDWFIGVFFFFLSFFSGTTHSVGRCQVVFYWGQSHSLLAACHWICFWRCKKTITKYYQTDLLKQFWRRCFCAAGLLKKKTRYLFSGPSFQTTFSSNQAWGKAFFAPRNNCINFMLTTFRAYLRHTKTKTKPYRVYETTFFLLFVPLLTILLLLWPFPHTFLSVA